MGVHAHVAGLRNKAEDATVLLAEGPHVPGSSPVRGRELAGERLLRDLRQIAIANLATGDRQQARSERKGAVNPQEEHVEHDAEAEHGQVHPLDGFERVGVLALEEVRRRDERAGEGRDALEALADVEPHRGVARCAEHGDVRVGGYLEAGEAASDDKGAADETAVLSEFGGRPEKDRAWVFFVRA